MIYCFSGLGHWAGDPECPATKKQDKGPGQGDATKKEDN